MANNIRLVSILAAAALSLPAGCRHGAGPPPPNQRVETDKVQVIEEHWPDGKLRLRKHVLRGPDATPVNHGTYTRWHDNGRREYEAVFVLGKKHGTAARWHKNGRKWTQEQYVHGKRHGPSYIWDENGRKRKEEHHVDGKPAGTWTVWDENGRIKSRQTFRADTREP